MQLPRMKLLVLLILCPYFSQCSFFGRWYLKTNDNSNSRLAKQQNTALTIETKSSDSLLSSQQDGKLREVTTGGYSSSKTPGVISEYVICHKSNQYEEDVDSEAEIKTVEDQYDIVQSEDCLSPDPSPKIESIDIVSGHEKDTADSVLEIDSSFINDPTGSQSSSKTDPDFEACKTAVKAKDYSSRGSSPAPKTFETPPTYSTEPIDSVPEVDSSSLKDPTTGQSSSSFDPDSRTCTEIDSITLSESVPFDISYWQDLSPEDQNSLIQHFSKFCSAPLSRRTITLTIICNLLLAPRKIKPKTTEKPAANTDDFKIEEID